MSVYLFFCRITFKNCLKTCHFNPWMQTYQRQTHDFKKSQSKISFNRIYYFPYIQVASSINRLKFYQTVTTIIAIPSTGILQLSGIVPYGTHVPVISIGFCGAALLYTLGIICNKMVGAIYTDSHGETVKISYVNFWGRRVDIVCPASDILPLSELPDRLDDLYVNLKQYSTDETLRCTFRYGSITDLDNFQKVFGNLKE